MEVRPLRIYRIPRSSRMSSGRRRRVSAVQNLCSFIRSSTGKPLQWHSNKTPKVYAPKYLILLDPLKTEMVLTQQWRGHPWQIEREFQRSFEKSNSHTIGCTGSAFRERNTITAIHVLLAVKRREAGGHNAIRPEMFKDLNRKVLWLTRVC